jgi:hypothetical protein
MIAEISICHAFENLDGIKIRRIPYVLGGATYLR